LVKFCTTDVLKKTGGQALMIERVGVTPRWSDAVIVGDIIFLAGHVADKTRGGSVTQQTEKVLQALEDTLAEAGVTKKNLVSVNIFLPDMSTFDEMKAVWDRWVAPDAPPTRATVEARLANPDLAVEMTAVAAR
jgi:enamine deaminase RidA (YjgF/YER057c/UK114 family)